MIARVSLHDGVTALGNGPGTFAAVYPSKLSAFFAGGAHAEQLDFAGYERHAHNEFVETLVESGIVGIAALLCMIFTWFWSTRSHLGDEKIRCAVAIVVTLLVASLADFPFHRAETWAILWVALGLGVQTTSAPSDTQVPEAARSAHAGFAVAKSAAAIIFIYFAAQPLIASRQTVLGAQAERSGDLPVAEIHYRNAIAHSAASQDAHFGLTRTLCKQDRFAACVAQSAIAARYVDEAELYLLRSRALRDLGRDSEAERELERARERFPFSNALP